MVIILYDDGYEVEITEKPKNAVRVYKLQNGDIFIVNNLILQFEDKILYEMIKNGLDMLGQQKWKRTGKFFTPEQLNKLMK